MYYFCFYLRLDAAEVLLVLAVECILTREVVHIHLATRDHLPLFLEHLKCYIKVPLSLLPKLFKDLNRLYKITFKDPQQSKIEVATRHR